MALGDPSSQIRFGQGQHASDTRALFLDVFGGEILTAFDLSTVTLDKHQVKTVGKGAKSWRFPKVWKATAEYHTPGTELLGNDIDTGEETVTIDDILVAHFGVGDLDEILSHFDARSPFAQELGRALARVYDKNVFRQVIKTARLAADGPFPGGTVIASDSLKADINGNYDGKVWVDAIRDANIKLYNKDVPEEMPRYLAVDIKIFDAIRFAKDANGNYLFLNREIGGTGSHGQRVRSIDVDGVTVLPTRNKPTANESADTTVYSKYRADYSKTLGVLWTPMAVATVKAADLGYETTRDTRRLEDFTVAKMLVGHGTLRRECALEFAAVT